MGIANWFRRAFEHEELHAGTRADKTVRHAAWQALPLLEPLGPRVLFDAGPFGTEPALPQTPTEQQAIVVDAGGKGLDLQDSNSPASTASPVLSKESDSAVASASVPVYRFWSQAYQRHFYTTNAAERDKLINRYAPTWSYEGIAYQAFADGCRPGVAPVHRFWSPSLHAHFYTVQDGEKDKLIRDCPGVWAYEGVAFYAFPPGAQAPGCSPVYRFWSDSLRCHFYTGNEAERDKLFKHYWLTWTCECVAWYGVSPCVPSASQGFDNFSAPALSRI